MRRLTRRITRWPRLRPAYTPVTISATALHHYRGLNCMLFVDRDGCLVQSRAGHDITRCFPDIAQAATEQLPPGTVVDGELLVWAEEQGCLDFPALQRRIVSPTRAAVLEAEQPATFMAFDLLAAANEDLRGKPLSARRARLEELAASRAPPLLLTPQTTDPAVAQRWMADYAAAPVGVEGVVIKPLGDPYQPGKRGWLKLRLRHTVEAIVGAVTGPLHAPTRLVLALPGKGGRLVVAGATTALTPAQAREVSALLRPPIARHPWPPELPAGRMGAFARDPWPSPWWTRAWWWRWRPTPRSSSASGDTPLGSCVRARRSVPATSSARSTDRLGRS